MPSICGGRAVPPEPVLCGLSPPSAEGQGCPYASPCQHLPPQQLRADDSGTSLVVQWLRICLPVQGKWVPSLFGELRSPMKVKVAQLCLTLCNPMDCSLPGSSARGILQARILEWVAIPFSRGSSQPWDQTQVFCIAGRFFTREAQYPTWYGLNKTNTKINIIVHIC